MSVRPIVAATPLVAIVLLACGLATAVVQPRPGAAQESPVPAWRLVGSDPVTYSGVRAMAPPLIQRYADEGLWDWDQLVLDLRVNPFYVRGDFDGDGATDVVVYVLVRASGFRGIAVLHGSVDKLRLFAKHESPDALFFPGHPRIEEFNDAFVGNYLLIHSAGTRIEPLPCSELGNYPGCEDAPFTLQHEAFEAVMIGRSAAVFVWRGDRYVTFVTAD